MKRYFVFIATAAILTACEEKQQGYVYNQKVDSASIGLTKRLDTVRKAHFPRPELPDGLLIDTGSNNPFAADSAYIPVTHSQADDRDRPTYRAPATENP